MNENKCSLCGGDNCQKRKEADFTTSHICSTYKTTVRIADALMSPHLFSEEHQNKMLNLICERIVDTPLASNGNYWAFIMVAQAVMILLIHKMWILIL